MTDTTDRFALPLLASGQAQKEMFHNEALARIDALLHACVEAVGADTPPAAPGLGLCWIVGSAPTGAFAGRSHALAVWTEGGWRFLESRPGMTAWSRADGLLARFDGSVWTVGDWPVAKLFVDGLQVVGSRAGSIPNPVGGGTVDIEARATISAILVALRHHGLVTV